MFFDEIATFGGFYFIGIGGVSMSALARLLHDRGAKVRGSDDTGSELTSKLCACGIPVHIGSGEKITEETVVYTGAIAEGHPQLKAARDAKKRLIGRAELLGMVASSFPHVLSVAGCHGKTTTSSMLAHIFLRGERPFTSHIGGEDLALGNYTSTGGDYFITEACEFKRSFLSLRSELAVILNCDRDHTDCYLSQEELTGAYRAFAANSQRVIVNADDLVARKIPHALSFGLYAGDIRAENFRSVGEKYSFTVTERGIPVIRVRLSVVGKVHVYNALAAYSAARLYGFTAEEIARGLENFKGVKRRFELVGTLCGAPVVCDYAHHPREIAATLETARRLSEGAVRVVFQPHTYTRTRDLMEGFVQALRTAENPIIYKTYAAREPFDPAGSAVALAGRIAGARYSQTPEQLLRRLKKDIGEGDMVLALGAGNIYDVMRGLTESGSADG